MSLRKRAGNRPSENGRRTRGPRDPALRRCGTTGGNVGASKSKAPFERGDDMRRTACSLIAVLGLWCADSASGAGPPARAALKFGITAVILQDQGEFLAQWEAHLEERLGRDVGFVQRGSYAEISELLSKDEIDIAWVCGAPTFAIATGGGWWRCRCSKGRRAIGPTSSYGHRIRAAVPMPTSGESCSPTPIRTRTRGIWCRSTRC